MAFTYSQSKIMVCRVCLALDVKMYDMKHFKLSEMFQNITGISACDVKESIHRVCWECAARLSAAAAFRDKALLSHVLLKDQDHMNKSDIATLKRIYHRTLKSPLTIQTVFTSCDIDCGGTIAENKETELLSDETDANKSKTELKLNIKEGGTDLEEEEPLIDVLIKTEVESDHMDENNFKIKIEDVKTEAFSEITHSDVSFTSPLDDCEDEVENIEEQISNNDEVLREVAKIANAPKNNENDMDIVEDALENNSKLDVIGTTMNESSSEEDTQNLAEVAAANKDKEKMSRTVGANRLNDKEKQKIIAFKEKDLSVPEIAEETGTSILKMSESKPRKKRGSTWDEDSLRRAMEAVQNNKLNTNAAAIKFNIPRRTLRNHILSGNSAKIIGKTTILTKQLEEDLLQRIIRFAKLGIPLTPKFIRKQAFLFCERFKIKHSFNMSTRMAGRKWLKMFLSRNPSISKRKPQLMNPARAQKMNKPIVKHHFEEVKKLYEELDIIAHPERLYNMDEKGCRITVHKQNVVLAERGNKRVHLVAPEHAENVTIAMCINALGTAIPPMIIFKGIRHRSELAENLPPGTKVSMAPKGSMTSSLFVEFFEHLALHKVSGKCLLIFDGAKCHLSYEALEVADKNNIVLYCLPSNTTHELQPLDKSVNRSFEHHWDEEVLNYLCNSQERTLNKAAFNKIFSRTWPKCMTQTNVTNGFKATGLYPFDPDVIPEDAYAPSIVTERPLSEMLQYQMDQPLISVQVSPPMSEVNKVSELSPKSAAATPKSKPVLVSYSFSSDDSDLELGIMENDQYHVSSVHVETDADTKHDPQRSLCDNPLPSTSGLQQNIVCSSSESDLDFNLGESFIKENYMSKLQVSDLYSFSTSSDDDLEQKGEITPKKLLVQNKSSTKES